jgi:hypothetical protein
MRDTRGSQGNTLFNFNSSLLFMRYHLGGGICRAFDDLIRSGFTPRGLPQRGTQWLSLRESWIGFFCKARGRHFPDIIRTTADLGFVAARDSTCVLYMLRS